MSRKNELEKRVVESDMRMGEIVKRIAAVRAKHLVTTDRGTLCTSGVSREELDRELLELHKELDQARQQFYADLKLWSES